MRKISHGKDMNCFQNPRSPLSARQSRYPISNHDYGHSATSENLSTGGTRVIPGKARRRLPSYTLYQLRSGRIPGIATTTPISLFYLSDFLI